MSTAFKVVIPARYESVRFPGKPLADIHGKPMIQRVYECAQRSGAGQVIIATDHSKIGMVAEDFGATVCMTGSDHASGTDRISEVVQKMRWDDDVIVVNLQGDEPMTPPELIRQVADNLDQHPDAACATLYTPMQHDDDPGNPNAVKLTFDNNGYALYFSRAAIPCHRDHDSEPPQYYRHIGMYAYRASLLKNYSQLPACELEQHEKLEQLRLLANGLRIHVAEACCLPGPGIDTPEDLEKLKLELEAASL